MKFLKISKEKSILEKNQFILKSTLENKRKNLKTIQNKNKEIKLERENKEKLQKKFIFDGSYKIIQLLNKLSKENNLVEDTIGRESAEQIEDKIFGSFYYSNFGREKDIFNFILEIEKEEKFISLKMDSILLEINGSNLDLKLNVMYIINNKKQEIDYFYYRDGIFEKSNNRNIGTKRRKF
ncbi:MAG: hypothetical protein ACRC5W_00145 [Cetobacterium sp.]|uniref:hypothetical protein n=1 Tax=Cetobacterium sp. TaxID=2071632 RepID=UPI003F2C4BD5